MHLQQQGPGDTSCLTGLEITSIFGQNYIRTGNKKTLALQIIQAHTTGSLLLRTVVENSDKEDCVIQSISRSRVGCMSAVLCWATRQPTIWVGCRKTLHTSLGALNESDQM